MASRDQLLAACLLPELQIDIGSDLDASHFDQFRQTFDTSFRAILNEPATDSQLTDDIRLLLILCEQSEPRVSSYVYQSQTHDIRQGVQRLLNESYRLDLWTNPDIIDKLMEWYRQRITSKKWLRQLGAVHGFATFCQVIYFYELIVFQMLTDFRFRLSMGNLNVHCATLILWCLLERYG